ncbi:MAG: hypothetical protein DWH91_15890 [Planctomycetota bacterium]|nr:MAG: hypothetical protein DWH91_15890 [Planctomycetota bacterium]
MNSVNRRHFLSRVGRGMIAASIGAGLASDLGIRTACALEAEAELTFGRLEPLVDLLQSTSLDKVLPAVVAQLKSGTSLRDFVAAAALANGRAFGGEDYIGFHTLMALRPALAMAEDLPTDQAALPVLKVLYRNSARIQEIGAHNHHALAPIAADAASQATADAIREAVHQKNRNLAEQLLAAAVQKSPAEGWNDLLATAEEATDVHRVVLVHRVWDMLDLVGEENALTMLRQSLRYCVKNEEWAAKYGTGIRAKLPAVVDQYKLQDRPWGTKAVDDQWVNAFVETLFTSTPDQAADAAGAALAEGINPHRIFEAISLTSNQLLLRDKGRTGNQIQPGKPEGSVHGDSIGVHASDSAHAWRGIALAGNALHRNTAVVLAAYQVAKDRTERGGDFQNWKPRPWAEDLEPVQASREEELLSALKSAIESQDQSRACALVSRYGSLNLPDRSVFDLLKTYAISQDGALHAEKYFHTTRDDFRATHAAARWRHVVALARVTASEFGKDAPGMAQARELLLT